MSEEGIYCPNCAEKGKSVKLRRIDLPPPKAIAITDETEEKYKKGRYPSSSPDYYKCDDPDCGFCYEKRAFKLEKIDCPE